jgi:hypothetical protein
MCRACNHPRESAQVEVTVDFEGRGEKFRIGIAISSYRDSKISSIDLTEVVYLYVPQDITLPRHYTVDRNAKINCKHEHTTRSDRRPEETTHSSDKENLIHYWNCTEQELFGPY